MSAPEGNKKRDYSRYDQMSTAELEQLLFLDFQASNDGQSDLDAILYISDLLAKRSEPADVTAAWDQFQTQYRPYADGRSLYDFEEEDCASSPKAEQTAVLTPARPRRTLRLRRLAILAALLIICLLGGMAAAQAAGVDVFDALARWTDETFHFTKGSSTPTFDSGTDEKSFGPIQSVLQSLGMDGLFPTWYPDDVTPWEPRVTDNYSVVAVSVVYNGDERNYSVVIQHFIQPTDNTGTFEKDNTPVEEYVHNGQVFYILSNLDTLTATTFDGEYMTIIAGALTREEIKTIIDSIPGQQPTQNHEQMRGTVF